MCDYSLAHKQNRLAETGEDLVCRNCGTGSKGLFSPTDTNCGVAVCVQPGAQLLVCNIPAHIQKEHDLDDALNGKFVQTSMQAWSYRDAIEFRNRRDQTVVVSLQQLEGVRVHILSLDSTSERTTHPEYAVAH
jgi:hypothetical protein